MSLQRWQCGQVLTAFVESLDKGSDQKMVTRHREWEKLIQAERDALAKATQVNRGGPAECCGMVRGSGKSAFMRHFIAHYAFILQKMQ